MLVVNVGLQGRVEVRFARPEDNGLNITQFRMQWAQTEPGPEQDFSTTDRNQVITVTDQSQTSYAPYVPALGTTGLNPNNTYKVRVQAISNRGTVSPDGRVATFIPRGSTSVPSNPTIMAEAVSATRSRAWISNVFDDGGQNILDYRWYYREVGSTEAYTEQNTTTQSIIIKHDRGVRYEVQVRARNVIGLSTFSNAVQIAAFNPSRPEAPTITVDSSTTVVPDTLKGVVSFSMGNLSTPEVVKDRIIQTAVRWTPAGGSDWTELEGSSYPNLTDNNFSAQQTFPATGNLTLDQALDVQARWRNSGGWSDWTDSIELGAVLAPSGALVLSKTQTTVQEGGSSIINVSLSRQPIEDTIVTITSSNTDLTISPSTLTFTESNWGTAQSITLSSIVDADQLNDIAIVTLRTTGGLTISDDTIAVTIQEPVRMIANWADGPIDIPEGGTASLIIGLTGEPSSNVNVTISKTGSDDITLNASSLTFTPANWKTQQVVTVSAASDADGDPDSANITIQATGGVSSTLTREVNVTDGVARVRLQATPAGASIGVGLSTTFAIRPQSAPNLGFVLSILPVNPNHISVSPSTMTFDRTNWDIARTLTVSIPSGTPTGLNEWITLEPTGSPDVQSHEIELVITPSLYLTGNPSAYIIPEGNRIPRPEDSGNSIGVQMAGTWPSGNPITITPTSDNPDLSFSLTHSGSNIISTSGNSIASFNIAAARDADVVSENIPVVFTASGGFTSSRSVPTMILEPTNTLRIVGTGYSSSDGVFTTTFTSGRYDARFTIRLLTQPPDNVRVRSQRVSHGNGVTVYDGSGPFYRNFQGHRILDRTATFTPSNYNTTQSSYWAFGTTSSLSSGDEIATYDLIPYSTNSSVSIPIQRIRLVAP